MADKIKRTETVSIDEISCRATSTVQWFLENRTATHPITHNNELKFFVCGKAAFEDIAQKIANAKDSIDICCWGFDPGMELVRNRTTWPRGETYGDLLVAAARKRHVKVRILVWYSKIGSRAALNMPGYSHGKDAWRSADGSNEAQLISANRSLMLAQEYYRSLSGNIGITGSPLRGMGTASVVSSELIARKAREEYCHSWYKAAFANLFGGLTIRTRAGDGEAIKKCLANEKYQPGGLADLEAERTGMVELGTHHQKTILIDYRGGERAVGYVKGLNSVTDYWDTPEHLLEDPFREAGFGREANESVQADEGRKADIGFKTYKPYRDYACRITCGGALIDVYKNFLTAWGRAGGDTLMDDLATIPTELKRKVAPGSLSSVQIVRTQPQENDQTVKEMYFHATDVAAKATGYLYIENQYFQYQEWSERLMQARKNVMAAWKAASTATGKTKGEMPLLHVFIVIPVAERAQMVPRTYDALAVIGQQAGMTGQSKFIDNENKRVHTGVMRDDMGRSTSAVYAKPAVVVHANKIDKPDADALGMKYGLKLAVAMLQTSGFSKRRIRYREIYIHSKLLLVDDSFFSLGSSNLNQRSMAVDSELNLSTTDSGLAAELRSEIWSQLSGGTSDLGNGSPVAIAKSFRQWKEVMSTNFSHKRDGNSMTGFLLPIADNRSASLRLG